APTPLTGNEQHHEQVMNFCIVPVMGSSWSLCGDALRGRTCDLTKPSYFRGGKRSLHCGISTLPLSALGQKQTPRHHGAMSALPPKADIRSARLNEYTP